MPFKNFLHRAETLSKDPHFNLMVNRMAELATLRTIALLRFLYESFPTMLCLSYLIINFFMTVNIGVTPELCLGFVPLLVLINELSLLKSYFFSKREGNSC